MIKSIYFRKRLRILLLLIILQYLEAKRVSANNTDGRCQSAQYQLTWTLTLCAQQRVGALFKLKQLNHYKFIIGTLNFNAMQV